MCNSVANTLPQTLISQAFLQIWFLSNFIIYIETQQHILRKLFLVHEMLDRCTHTEALCKLIFNLKSLW